MTTKLSRERLESLKRQLKENGYNYITERELMELICMALASMEVVKAPVPAVAAHEQEPYGYVHKAIYESTGSSGLTNDHAAYRGTNGSHVPVFLHPAPVPAVPEKIPDSVYQVIYEQCGGFVDCDANPQKIWNACRAAMLNGGKS